MVKSTMTVVLNLSCLEHCCMDRYTKSRVALIFTGPINEKCLSSIDRKQKRAQCHDSCKDLSDALKTMTSLVVVIVTFLITLGF